MIGGNKVNNYSILTPKEEFQSRFVESLDEAIYHSDRSAVNSSSLKLMLKSAASFHASFFGGARKTETSSMKLGKLVHEAILEPTKFFARYRVMPDFGHHHASNAYKAAKAAWMNDQPQGSVVTTEPVRDQIHGMVRSILEHEEATKLLSGGKSEITGYYVDPNTGIKCRIRPDFLHFDLKALVDLKTTRDCTYREFSKSVWKYRYDFQMAMYCEGVKQITGMEVQYPAIIAVEKEPPYEVAAYVLDEGAMDKGLQDYRKAMTQLRECLSTGMWKRYQSGLQNMSLPTYAWSEE